MADRFIIQDEAVDDSVEPEDADENAVHDQIIREFIHNSKSVRSLQKDTKGRPYNPKLCVFRAIADLLKNDTREQFQQRGSLREVTQRLFDRWCQHAYEHFVEPHVYPGTDLRDLTEIEKFFNLQITVFKLNVVEDGVTDDVEPLAEEEDEMDLIRRAEENPDRQAILDELLRTAAEDENVEVEGTFSQANTNTDEIASQDSETDDQMDSQNADQPGNRTPLVRASLCRRTLNQGGAVKLEVLLFKDHFYRITKINAFCKTWRCERCGKFFAFYFNCDRHQKKCTGEMRREYPDTGFTLPKQVWQRLRDRGFSIDDQFYDEFISYDAEAIVASLPQPSTPTGLKMVKKLIPLSLAMKSTFNGGPGTDYHETKFFCHEDPRELIRLFHSQLLSTAKAIGANKKEKYQDALDFAKPHADTYRDLLRQLKEVRTADDPGARRALLNQIFLAKQDATTYAMLDRWIHQVPVVGYNSGKFDLNLMREYLLPEMLDSKDDRISNIIKRGNDFMSISTTHLLFLDMMHYLPPGVSLDDFIKAYGPPGTIGKFYWCYEYIDRYEKLLEPFPTDKAVFWSSLKNQGITDEQFAFMHQLYMENNCNTLLELLAIYNKQDVDPFQSSNLAFYNLFKAMGIDIFKMSCISLPGVAMRRMFSRQGQTIVPLFTSKYSNWHTIIRNNIVGGPAIVFKRAMKVGDCIRGTDGCGEQCCNCKKCKRILGFDANSLYLYCTGKDMPAGIPRIYNPTGPEAEQIPTKQTDGVSQAECEARIARNMSKRLKTEIAYSSMYEVPWVLAEYRRLQQQNPGKQLTLQHQFNGGQALFLSTDKKLRIYADGYIPELRTVLEYNGCWWHGHDCDMVKSRVAASPNSVQEEFDRRFRRQQTLARHNELVKQGLTMVTIWECEDPLRNHPLMQDAVDEVLPKRLKPNPTVQSLVEEIRSGQFFGVVECDLQLQIASKAVDYERKLQVPWWRLDLREKMAELPPIFKNVTISRDDIGPYMKQHAEEHGLMKQPRRSLISSFHGTKLCLISPMLQYLTQLGVVITNIYGAVEYARTPMFDFITKEVTEARRAADNAGTDRVVVAKGNIQKLIGNSCYGKCLTNLESHENVHLMNETDACTAINNPMFTKLDPVDKDHYLVHSTKSTVVHNLPVLVAFFVYGYAKQRMLEFYYDFLLKYLGPSDFELIQMDTDSFYLATCHESIDHLASFADYARFVETTATKRQPGLFKLEWSGDAMIALNPKCYYGLAMSGEKNKVSMKGVSHRTNTLTYEQYLSVLQAEQTGPMAVNKGFMMRKGHIEQYELHKLALTHLYIKRRVLRDMISTMPLDL